MRNLGGEGDKSIFSDPHISGIEAQQISCVDLLSMSSMSLDPRSGVNCSFMGLPGRPVRYARFRLSIFAMTVSSAAGVMF